jgi:hypothetical protein
VGSQTNGDDAAQRELDRLLTEMSERHCPGERLALAGRFALLAARPTTSGDVRRRALRAVQDLARRKVEESPCVRGLDQMKAQTAARSRR